MSFKIWTCSTITSALCSVVDPNRSVRKKLTVLLSKEFDVVVDVLVIEKRFGAQVSCSVTVLRYLLLGNDTRRVYVS